MFIRRSVYEKSNINHAPRQLFEEDDCDKWVEFSWNRYSEKFLFPNNDIDYYDDIGFLLPCENDVDDDYDFTFDLLCEEMDEIFLQ